MLHRVNPPAVSRTISRMMTDPIVIRKYENRRLYDTRNSCYVNLDGVAEMVRSGHDIQVVDSKTGEDVTRHVLTQIIVDGARDPDRGPPLEFLRDLVRARDQAGREFFQWYLRSAGEIYERVRETVRSNPFAPDPSWMRLWEPRAIVEQMHAQMTRQVEGVFGEQGSGAGKRQESSAATDARQTAASQQDDRGDSARAELDELKNRLQDLERRLGDAGG